MVDVRAGAWDKVRYLMLSFHFFSHVFFPSAQRIAFNREQRMFKVSTVCLLLTSIWWEQDVMGAVGVSEGMVMDPEGVKSHSVGN